MRQAQLGWASLFRTIGVSVLLTSVFWVAVGAWLVRNGTPATRDADTPSPGQAQQSANSGSVTGLGQSSLTLAESRAGLTIPVAGVKKQDLVDTFTQARAAGARRHDAIDIMAPDGTAVVAAAPGRIEKLFLSDEGGNTIYIRSPDRTRTYYYAHLESYAPGLREGMQVRKGDRLGTVGHTGNADPQAPHLHFAIWGMSPDAAWHQEGTTINPYPLLSQGR